MSERDGNWGSAGGLPVAERPSAPATDPSAAAARSGGFRGAVNHRDLVSIHDHLRTELGQIEAAVQEVASGVMTPGDARTLINTTTMRQNQWALGAFCASYCRLVTMHHSVEDAYLFPTLAVAEPSLQAVLDRLEAEHVVIAGVLDNFDRALVDLVRRADDAGPGGDGLSRIEALARQLSDLLRSHLAYEEDELADGLGRMSGPI
ncbi:hemerythrin domain-containing protein [Nakamurella sp. GG22]